MCRFVLEGRGHKICFAVFPNDDEIVFNCCVEGRETKCSHNYSGRYTSREYPLAYANKCINITNNMLALDALIAVKSDHFPISSKKAKTFFWRKRTHLQNQATVLRVR
jgi:hypothetical protein